MDAPPTSVTTLDPLLELPAASRSDTATLRAVPMHLAGLKPVLTGHGSGYKSSNIELRANSHSLTGTKKRFIAELSPLFIGS